MVGLNRVWYYRHRSRERERQEVASKVLAMIAPIRAMKPRIGGRKLYYMLGEQLSELGVGRDKFFDILRANNLLVIPRRSYRVTTNSKHMFHKHKNLVGDYVPQRPEEVWVSDITYIDMPKGHTYLALVTDAYSKKIVGYDLSDSLEADGAVRALRMARLSRRYADNILIHHSDRGVQYCCDKYQKELKKSKMRVSMTESYDPYANAVAERVNGILKQEFMLEEMGVRENVLGQIVKQSINTYNTIRPHSSCEMLTPEQMHR